VQRMLFWYTPQILRFHNETALVLGELCKIVEKQSDSIGDAQKEITAQRREREFESRPGTGTSDLARSPASFDFSLQDYFRGPETDTSEKLKGWLDAIEGEGLSGRRLDGPWLDIGCGRGEWLSLASQRGYDISGVDSSPVSVGYCKSKGARVSHADAIGYLRGLADNSLAVATAFHVVEHLKMDTLATLIALAAQKLRPDGILAIETPDPANLLMSSHHFWNDPTHERPIPRALMEYVFQHFGFSVLRRLRLNPFPPEERLSHTEFEPVRRVDELLYGPRDYGLIGRRES
ncbi:MAG TPA: class I SAM-dependent methyltransferase, partial [Bryobacteraceae bacterium]|nr:class I SAM-dependent methyltransferase [Bryobacteraceae bacterium]